MTQLSWTGEQWIYYIKPGKKEPIKSAGSQRVHPESGLGATGVGDLLQSSAPGETSPQQLSIAADSLACPPLPGAEKDTAVYSRSDEMLVINQRGGEMGTVSFQITNSVAEITGLPKDEWRKGCLSNQADAGYPELSA